MDMGTTSVSKLLLRLSPPVMLALLIQSVYNIVDSFFVARYSEEGLTALSIIYPLQLLMTALATGTGTGINILISRMDGCGEREKQHDVIRSGLFLAVIHFLMFAFFWNLLAKEYFAVSSGSELVRTQGTIYMRIVCAGSLGLFIESACTKVLQARGDMLLPMAAQVTGSVINVVLDLLLIFGQGGFPRLGIAGAAIATVIGQWAAMLFTLSGVIRSHSLRGHISRKTCTSIYQNGIGSIVTQSLYTFYIIGLNMILKGFTEDAVTVLGLYYKIQTFFFIPLLGFQQVLIPVISYNYGAGRIKRARQILRTALIISSVIMTAAMLIFLLFPRQLLAVFTDSPSILTIGSYAFPVISLSFIFAGFTIAATSYLQGIGRMKISVFIVILRQILLLVPLAWILHFFGLNAVWWTFPLTEIIAGITALLSVQKPAPSACS